MFDYFSNVWQWTENAQFWFTSIEFSIKPNQAKSFKQSLNYLFKGAGEFTMPIERKTFIAAINFKTGWVMLKYRIDLIFIFMIFHVNRRKRSCKVDINAVIIRFLIRFCGLGFTILRGRSSLKSKYSPSEKFSKNFNLNIDLNVSFRKKERKKLESPLGMPPFNLFHSVLNCLYLYQLMHFSKTLNFVCVCVRVLLYIYFTFNNARLPTNVFCWIINGRFFIEIRLV